MTMRSRRVGTVVAVAACVAALAGCTKTVSGQAVLGSPVVTPSPSPAAPPPRTSNGGGQVVDFDLCSLLDWQDLPYDREGVGGFGPTSDVDSNYEQSCSWTASQGKSKGITQLLFSKRPTVKVKKPTGTFLLDGERVKIGEITEGEQVIGCVTVLDFAGGRLGIAVDDTDHVFGEPCVQTQDVARMMAKREPS